MKPLYVTGTQRHAGKTTFCVGLVHALRGRGMSIGYAKPLGQRVGVVAGEVIHDDALVVSQAMAGEGGTAQASTMAVPLTRGRVEKEIYDLNTPQLAGKVSAIVDKLREANDLVIIEGMGHVAAGSCLRMSAADVARIIDAPCLIVSGGGIGRAIDDISMCATFITAHGARLLGAVVNKVWPEKYARIKEATTKGLEILGIHSFGTVPYEEVLATPTFGQVVEEFNGEVLCGHAALGNRVGKAVVAAMEADHMVSYLKDRAMVITPGDRSDNILAILSLHMLSTDDRPVAGIVLTGGFRPSANVINLMSHSGLPVMLCREDTYTLATRMGELVFKIKPNDKDRLETAMCLVSEYVDVNGILEGLKE
ncbi:MAG: phosphotransacetylase family protein [Phycisphaerae bacterium]